MKFVKLTISDKEQQEFKNKAGDMAFVQYITLPWRVAEKTGVSPIYHLPGVVEQDEWLSFDANNHPEADEMYCILFSLCLLEKYE